MTFGVNDGSLTIENGSTTPKIGTKSNGVSKSPNSKPILHPDLVIRSKDEIPAPESLALEEELPGWHGYVEWEQYPERKQKVKEFMKKFDFPGVSLLLVLQPLQTVPRNLSNALADKTLAPRIPTCTATQNEPNP
jgi:uncharacterized protein YfaQ (DUF2300 family)